MVERMNVTRRSFLQSMAAAFSATALGVRMSPAQPAAIRYELFTDTSAWVRRHQICEPFSLDGAVYATDARVLITHPGEWSGSGNAKVPDVGKLWWDEFDKPGWKELPEQRLELTTHDSSLCHLCMGLGRVGDGVHRVLCRDEDGDPEWAWAGGAKCHQCNGTGWEEEYPHVDRIDGAAFSPGYMNRLRTLGGLDYRILSLGDDRRVHPRGNAEVLLVRGDGGVRGMLMCVHED